MISVAGEWLLLVDDNADVTFAFATCLEHAGYRSTASSGQEALEIATAKRHEIALVLTDLAMPGMAGRGSSATLRRDGVQAPVIVMSGRPRDEGVIDPLDDEIAVWLQKPFTVDDLVDAVGRTLAQQSAGQTG
jgi:DNA-binding response OmpR family regulator